MVANELRRIAKRVSSLVTDITDYSGQVDPIADTALFNVETVPDVIEKITQEVKAGYAAAYPSKIGGPVNMAIMLTLSIESRTNWKNGILENSTYGKFVIERDGTVEQTSGYSPVKFRKTKCRSIDMVISKLNQWVERNQ